MEFNKSNTFLYSSEQVSGGHPDKLCDYISDSIVDAYLEVDPDSKVACETMAKGYFIIVAGEIYSQGTVDFDLVIRRALTEIGYTIENGYDQS